MVLCKKNVILLCVYEHSMIRKFYYTTFGGVRKNSKLALYLQGAWLMLQPKWFYVRKAKALCAAYDAMQGHEKEELDWRINYYCALPDTLIVDKEILPCLGDSHLMVDHKKQYLSDIASIRGRLAGPISYFFDSYEYSRCFPQNLRWMIRGGDVNRDQEYPSIAKSRPVLSEGMCSNNVLLKLNRIRHFIFFDDPFRWEDKKPIVLFRGAVVNKPRRQQFVDMWVDSPLCDIADTSQPGVRGMSIYDHLRYRYIMSLEGNDVASNLKWVMSSNSIAVMPRPTCETWFMEGRLVGGKHYIEIAPDYHDLQEKILYYESHPDQAKAIIRNAHEWVAMFKDTERERMVSMMVMRRYLEKLNGVQIFSSSPQP